MKYMINVDVESTNVAGGGPDDCPSALHRHLGDHYDLTVHSLDCGSRNSRAVHRPPSRFWDDNQKDGYTFEEVISRVRELREEYPKAYPRRCSRCGVDSHRPDWD